jgi:hypothetical protein
MSKEGLLSVLKRLSEASPLSELKALRLWEPEAGL